MDGTVHRRALIGGLAAAAASGAAARAQAASVRFSGILVDVRPLQAKGLGGFAEFLRAVLHAELTKAFADRLGGGRGAPRLVVRIDGISFPTYVGRESNDRFFGGSITNDYLDGEALVVAPDGQVLARHPQLSALPASSGGAWYDERSEQRRVVAIAAHYAGWLRRSPI